MNDVHHPTSLPSSPPRNRDGDHDPHTFDIAWFLRRELVSIPLAIIVVGTLLVFGVSPATLLFLLLLTVVTLGWILGRGDDT